MCIFEAKNVYKNEPKVQKLRKVWKLSKEKWMYQTRVQLTTRWYAALQSLEPALGSDSLVSGFCIFAKRQYALMENAKTSPIHPNIPQLAEKKTFFVKQQIR